MSQKWLVERGLALENAVIGRFAPLDAAFVDPSSFDWTERVEAEIGSIKLELQRLLDMNVGLPSMTSLSDRQEGLGGTNWQALVLRMQGSKVPSAAALCPQTYDLVNNIKEIDSAMLSVLQPGATIENHCGPSKAELRYHLPLVVPTSDPEICGIRVGDTTRGWSVGESLIFDDTIDHEAWNHSEQVRVVLFIGCRRPMPALLARIVDAVHRKVASGHPDVLEILDKSEAQNHRIIAELEETVIDLRDPLTAKTRI